MVTLPAHEYGCSSNEYVAIERRVNGLYREGVLVPPAEGGRIRFAPASSDAAETIEHIVAAFRSHPSRVIEVIYSKPGRE